MSCNGACLMYEDLIEEVKELKRVIDKVIKNVDPYIKAQSTHIVPVILWKAQIAMSELKKAVK